MKIDCALWQAEEANLLKLLLNEDNNKKLGLSFGSGGGDGGADTSASSGKDKEVKKEEKAAPVVEEKKAFDIELSSFAPENKIKIIKELKNLLNLGLAQVGCVVTRQRRWRRRLRWFLRKRCPRPMRMC